MNESQELLKIFSNHIIRRNLSLILNVFSDEIKKDLKKDPNFFKKKENLQMNMLQILMPLFFFFLLQWTKILKKAEQKIITLSSEEQKDLLLEILLNYILPLYVVTNEQNIVYGPSSLSFGTLQYGTTILGVFPDKNVKEVLNDVTDWHYVHRYHSLLRDHIIYWKNKLLQNDTSKSYDGVEFIYMELKLKLNNNEIVLPDWCSEDTGFLRLIVKEKQSSLEYITLMLSGKGGVIHTKLGDMFYKDIITLGELFTIYIQSDDVLQYYNKNPDSHTELYFLKICHQKLLYLQDIIANQNPGNIFINRKPFYESLMENMEQTLDFSNLDHIKAYNYMLSAICIGLKTYKDLIQKDPKEDVLWSKKKKNLNSGYSSYGKTVNQEVMDIQSKMYPNLPNSEEYLVNP